MWAHPRSESKGAKLERKSQPVMPPRPDMLDVVGGQRVMAQQGGFVRGQVEQGGAVRKGIVQRTAQSVVPTPAKPEPGASHMNGTETIAEAGPYPYTSPHDGNAHRIRALFHRPAGSGRPAPGAPGAGRRRGSHLHRSRPHRHHPRPTGWQGPSQMRAPSPIGFGNGA